MKQHQSAGAELENHLLWLPDLQPKFSLAHLHHMPSPEDLKSVALLESQRMGYPITCPTLQHFCVLQAPIQPSGPKWNLSLSLNFPWMTSSWPPGSEDSTTSLPVFCQASHKTGSYWDTHCRRAAHSLPCASSSQNPVQSRCSFNVCQFIIWLQIQNL